MSPFRSSGTREFFSEEDHQRIAAAVDEAEGKTSGEIVPYVVDSCDDYEVALWRCGASCTALVLLVFFGLRYFSTLWLPVEWPAAVLAAFTTGAVGALLTHFVPALKRFFAGRELLDRRVSRRAAEAFVAEEVFNTRERTGILIFLSLLEHEVVVIGDAGINARVETRDWEDVVQRVVAGMRAGKPADGLVAAIQQSGALLERLGVQIRSDDTDELPNRLRTGEDPRP